MAQRARGYACARQLSCRRPPCSPVTPAVSAVHTRNNVSSKCGYGCFAQAVVHAKCRVVYEKERIPPPPVDARFVSISPRSARQQISRSPGSPLSPFSSRKQHDKAVLQIMETLIAYRSKRNQMIQEFGLALVLFTAITFITIFIRMMGYWKMKKWGVYVSTLPR
jgi:hypothetical protein